MASTLRGTFRGMDTIHPYPQTYLTNLSKLFGPMPNGLQLCILPRYGHAIKQPHRRYASPIGTGQ